MACVRDWPHSQPFYRLALELCSILKTPHEEDPSTRLVKDPHRML